MSDASPVLLTPDVVGGLAGKRVLVVGDIMLDAYLIGDADRISPEAPVPVVQIEKERYLLGGAGNVARNIVALGGVATLAGVMGKDASADRIRGLVRDEGICGAFVVLPQRPTTVKTRVMARRQQMLRLDSEDASPLASADQEALLSVITEQLPAHDVVILSDYGKGGLTHIAEMIRIARAADKPVLVDPKGDEWGKYAGATVITPNRSELKQVVGSWKNEEELAAKAGKLRGDLGLEALLVTRSEEGMTLFADEVHHQPAKAQEVFDVSGAGDTVIATLAVMLAAGAAWDEAIRVANIAAGIVVGKLGTAVVTRQELLAAL